MMEKTTNLDADPQDVYTSALKRILGLSCVFGLVALMIAYRIDPRREVLFGVWGGWGLAVANYYFLVKIVSRLLKSEQKKKPVWLLLITKMVILILVIYLCFWILQVEILAFVGGYMALVLAILMQSLMASLQN